MSNDFVFIDDFASNFVKCNTERKHEQTAKQFCAAIQTIANKPQNLENFEIYLSMHFGEWLEKFANTPETITAEMRAFAEMEV